MTVENFPAVQDVKVVNTPLTHMGRLPQDHVMLHEFLDPLCVGDKGLARIFPDGAVDPTPFVVPPGKALVLTDVSVRVDENIAWQAGDLVTASILLQGPGGKVDALEGRGGISAETAASGITFVQAHSNSGIVAGAGVRLCLRASIQRPGFGGVADTQFATVQGYLIDE